MAVIKQQPRHSAEILRNAVSTAFDEHRLLPLDPKHAIALLEPELDTPAVADALERAQTQGRAVSIHYLRHVQRGAVPQVAPTEPFKLNPPVKMKAPEDPKILLTNADHLTVVPQGTSELPQSAYFKGIGVQGVRPDNREWAINYAVLTHFAQSIKDAAPEQCQMLRARALQYLLRFAPLAEDESRKFAIAVTPLFVGHQYYFRSGGAPLLKAFSRDLENGLAAGVYVVPVSDGAAMDAVQRQLSHRVAGEDGWQHHSYVAMRDAWAGARSTPAPSIIDVGPVLKAVSTELMEACKHLASSDAHGAPPRQFAPDEFDLQQLSYRLEFVVDLMIDEIASLALKDGLATEQLAPEPVDWQACARAMVAATAGDLAFTCAAEIGSQPVVLVIGIGKNYDNAYSVRKASSDAGYFPGPSQVLENWVTFAPPENIYRCVRLCANAAVRDAQVTLPSTTAGLKAFGSAHLFATDPGWRKLDELVQATAPQSAGARPKQPAAFVYGRMIMNLVKGLDIELAKGRGQDPFADPHLAPVACFVANRLLAHVSNAIAHADSLPALINHFHLAFEELSTLIALAAPYEPHDLSLGWPAIGKSAITPQYSFHNGGMHGLSSVLNAVEAMKGTAKSTKGVNAMTLRGSYFEETLSVIDPAPRYRHAVLDGKDPSASLHTMRNWLAQGESLDVFVCDFDHNISTELDAYQTEDVADCIKAIFAEKMPVATPLTIAIDVTSSLNNDPKIAQLAKALSQEIEAGQINLVFFRSGQKFDLGGIDHRNGGFAGTYAAPPHTLPPDMRGAQQCFLDTMAVNYDHKAENFQEMTHFQKYANLDEYRHWIADAHLRLTGRITSGAAVPKEMVVQDMTHKGVSAVVIAPNAAVDPFFIDLRSAIGIRMGELESTIRNLCAENGLMVGTRLSFGFPHLNVMPITGSDRIRLTVGLESEADLEKLSQILRAFHEFGEMWAQLGVATPPKNCERMISAIMAKKSGDMARCDVRQGSGGNVVVDMDSPPTPTFLDHLDPYSWETRNDSACTRLCESALAHALAFADLGRDSEMMALLDHIDAKLPVGVRRSESVANAYHKLAKVVRRRPRSKAPPDPALQPLLNRWQKSASWDPQRDTARMQSVL